MSETVEQILQHGLTLHRWGQTEMASQIYTTVLTADPKQPEANYNMGLLSVESGRTQDALAFFETALESNADIADYWVSYINALLEVGRVRDAQAVFDQAKMNGARGDGFDKLQHQLSEASEKSSKISNRGIYEKQKLPNILDSLNLFEAMKLARKKVKEGLPDAAASIYQDILYKSPNNKKARLGMKSLSVGSIKHASKVQDPPQDQLQALIELCSRGLQEQALKQAEILIQRFSMSAILFNIQGIILKDLKEFDLSRLSFEKAVALKPNFADAYNNMGNAFKAQGELEKAIVAYKKALAIKPNYASGYYNLGVVLTEQGKLEEAVETYKKALVINPAYVDAYYNLGAALKDQGKPEQAVEAYSKALAIKPDDANILNNMGITFKEQGELEKAIETFNMALAIKPDYAEAYNNLGVALKEQGNLEEAVEIYKKALLIKPDFAAAYTNMGNALKDQGKLEQAIETLNTAIAISPDDAEAHHYLSFALLNTGRLKEGLDEAEWRWKIKSDVSGERRFLQPLWDGKVSLQNKRILVWCEQGIGDIIRCSSLLPLISSQAQHCILECPQKLIPLFSQSFPNIEVRPENRSLDLKRDDFDFQLPTGSLHKHFLAEVTRNTKPSAYLVPDPIRLNFWKSRLSSLGSGPYVGISWKSSLMQGERLKFYAPVFDWGPLLKLENTTFINLQYVDAEDDLIQIRDEYGVTVHNFDDLDQYNKIADVAALCAALDCVVSISNAVPTISAGVGTPTKYAVPAIYDWDNIIGNPVGPTVDIFKRNSHSPWSNVFALIAKDIAKL